MKLTIEHLTHYRYKHEVFHSIQYLRLTPKSTPRQNVLAWELEMPEQAARSSDSYGNILHVLTLDKPHDRIAIAARGEVDIDARQPDGDDILSPFTYLRSTSITRADNNLRTFAATFRGAASHAHLRDLSRQTLLQMPYEPGSTEVTSTAAQAFAAGRGVCQDHTHVFLACCRLLGLPARYVSGYLYTDHQAHVASHAWAEVWLNNQWYMFDITNQLSEPSHHLKLAVGLDYMDACPVRGVRFGGGEETMHAFALVERQESQQ